MARSLDDLSFGSAIEVFFQSIIFYSLATFFIELEFFKSENSLVGPRFFLWSERVVASIFTVEYVLRWVRSRRWSYPFTFTSIVDLLAVLPFYVGFLVDLRVLRLIRTLRMLRLFKLHRYNTALRSFVTSIRSVRDQLGALGIVVLFFVMLSSSILFECEHLAQPQVFAKFSDAVWWCITTLTTVGYGDKFPITSAGRVTATFTVVFGLGVFGTFISVIGGAFLQTHRGTTHSIRISRACFDHLTKLIHVQGKDISSSSLAETVEQLAEEAVRRHGSSGIGI
ncbi:MAG TPA: ion transporter [Polyangiaceae bacterium]